MKAAFPYLARGDEERRGALVLRAPGRSLDSSPRRLLCSLLRGLRGGPWLGAIPPSALSRLRAPGQRGCVPGPPGRASNPASRVLEGAVCPQQRWAFCRWASESLREGLERPRCPGERGPRQPAMC